jgi:RsiW-degrading membrane proteinase PrsW (M82 family)
MPARMTPTVWRQGAANAMICGSILLASCLLIARLISSVTNHSLAESFWLAWSFLWGLSLLLFLCTWIYTLNERGPVVLDCGPHPTRVLFWINAATFLLIGFGGGFKVSSLSKSFTLAGPVLGISAGIFYLILV